MRKFFYASMLVPAMLSAGTLQEDLKLVLNADSPVPAGVRVAGSIRLVPGKFGKGYLIERRTINEFKPSEVSLSDGATLKGDSNTLTLPAGGDAALPITSIRPKSVSTLSFRASGTGKLTIKLDETVLKTIELKEKSEFYFVPCTAPADSFTLRIAADKGAVLDQVMFDKNISYANTYQKPGVMRGGDDITFAPQKYYNQEQGAISFWVKAPWLDPQVKGVVGVTVFGLQWTPKRGKQFWDNYNRSILVWNDAMLDIFYGDKKTSGGASFKLNERKIRPADGWNHIVMNWKTADGKLMSEIIVNGEQTFTRTSVFRHRPAPQTFLIGYVGGSYLNGILDDFAIFSRPLTKEEAKQIFNSGKPLK